MTDTPTPTFEVQPDAAFVHVRDGKPVQSYGTAGWIDFSDGGRMSPPAKTTYEPTGEKVVPVVIVEGDMSSYEDKYTIVEEQQALEAEQYTVTRMRRDMTDYEKAQVDKADISDEEIRAAFPALSARQIRLALIGAGISLAAVAEKLDAIPDPAAREAAQVEWEYATEYRRDHALLLQLASDLGLSDEQVDAMWAAAQAL